MARAATARSRLLPFATIHPFRHEALFFDGDDTFVAGTAPFVRAGLEAGEPVMVALTPRHAGLLAGALGADAGDVTFVDMTELGANPARIIPAWRAFLDEHANPGRGVRGIGEPIWADRTADELVECQLHEALLNRAFAGADGFRLLCPYDTGALSEPVIREARCSHPLVTDGGGPEPSSAYRGPDAVPPGALAPLPPPHPGAHSLSFDAHSLGEVRAAAAGCAREAGLGRTAREDLVLAVSELAVNSILHAARIGVLRTWTEGDAAVCEIRDTGRIDDPLAGRHRPQPDQLDGRGLWLANQLCDLVQVRSGADGTVVRVRRAS